MSSSVGSASRFMISAKTVCAMSAFFTRISGTARQSPMQTGTIASAPASGSARASSPRFSAQPASHASGISPGAQSPANTSA